MALWRFWCGMGLALAFASLSAAQETDEAENEGPTTPFLGEDIRDRLTEREDENRLETPFTIDLFGHPLTLSGEYEIGIEGTDQIVRGDPPDGEDRAILEQEIEAEAFYTLGPALSIQFQIRVGMEEDVLGETHRGLSDRFVERGLMWLFTEDLFGTGVDVEVGRLDFEDDRTWWWDEELDAIRLALETEPVDVELSFAYELGPTRSDQWFIDPEQDERLRVLVELSWDLAEDHGIEWFSLFDEDLSEEGHLGARIRSDREDESDAHLFWFGPRAIGGFDFGSAGILAYWVDAAWVRGRERLLSFERQGGGRSAVNAREHRDVSAWAFDMGTTYFFRAPFEPRISLGYAMGSGDGSPDEGSDRSFRQTGLQSNETGYGGVQRFGHYGRLLDPELSNLKILTAGVGVSLFRTSSADLVYHYYRLAHRAQGLRDARLETELNGRDKNLGHGLDAILAIEEGDRFEIEISGSLFRSGAAFGRHRHEWSFGAFAALRVAF